ncbi:MAG: hypothetical protein KBT46_02665, partial [Ruminococcus sp.]|nr:hypothetical protein [Candidatus Copronaster equi]
SDAANKFSTIDNNGVYGLQKLKKIFADPKNGDYTLNENSPVFAELSDFEPVPITEIGRYPSK